MCVWHSRGETNVWCGHLAYILVYHHRGSHRAAASARERAENVEEKINKFARKIWFVVVIDWLIGAVIGWFDLDEVNWDNWGRER